MNEFGEIGIDGTLVEGDDIDMLEISRGSIFCVCVKTDFIKGLYELSAKVKPDVLLIESTGLPTLLISRGPQSAHFHDRFQFMEQFCLVDAATSWMLTRLMPPLKSRLNLRAYLSSTRPIWHHRRG